MYVVSGPAFIGEDIKRVGNVLVPTHIWKLLYSPKQQRAGAYVVTNDETREHSTLSVSDLEKMVGIILLPGLPKAVRDGGMDLPKPSSQRASKKPKSQKGQAAQEEFTLRDFSRSIIDAIGRAIKH